MNPSTCNIIGFDTAAVRRWKAEQQEKKQRERSQAATRRASANVWASIWPTKNLGR